MTINIPFPQRACFIAGSAKSGSTLLAALLDGHPELLVIPEETAYFPTVRRKYISAPRARQAEYLTEEAEVRLLFETAEVDHGNRDYRTFPRVDFREKFLMRATSGQPSEDLLAMLAGALADVTQRDQESIRWWVEKTPANRWCVPDIRNVFPQSRLLLTMRDPRAVASAVLKRSESKGFKGFSLYLCAKYWVQSAKLYLEHQNDPASLGVCFEDLLRNPEEKMRDVSAFLGVEFSEHLLQPTKGGRSWRGNSSRGQRFSSISTGPIDAWKNELPEQELAFVEQLCSPWMRLLGYDPILKTNPGSAVLIKRYPCETIRGYVKDRRRMLGDFLIGFWNATRHAAH